MRGGSSLGPQTQGCDCCGDRLDCTVWGLRKEWREISKQVESEDKHVKDALHPDVRRILGNRPVDDFSKKGTNALFASCERVTLKALDEACGFGLANTGSKYQNVSCFALAQLAESVQIIFDMTHATGKEDALVMSQSDAHSSKLAEVCMKQAARLEQMHDDLDKARQGERAAREELEKSLRAHELERAEFGDKVEQMKAMQASLLRENNLLLEELISVLGRTKALRAEMVWLQQFLPGSERSATPFRSLQTEVLPGPTCTMATGQRLPPATQVLPPTPAVAVAWTPMGVAGLADGMAGPARNAGSWASASASCNLTFIDCTAFNAQISAEDRSKDEDDLCYKLAICVRQQLLGDEHEELLASIEKYVVSCNSWGVHCLGTGNFTAALELFKKAEAMTEADNVPNFKSRVALRAVTFNNLCCYYRTRGKLNAALQFAEKALKIEQRYKEADSPARSFLNYGVLLSNSGRHNEALEHVERAVAVLHDQERHQEAEVGGGSEPSETAQLLVVAHYNMFVENLHLKHFATCLQCLQRAVNVAQSKLGSSHNLTIKMQGVQAEAQARLERKASAECFRTTAAVVESSPVFFHYQDGHCHPWQKVNIAQTDATRAQEILADQKQITLRRLRPVDPRPPEKPRIRSRRPKPQIYARLPAIGNEVTSRWWASHPKLLDTEGYAGSPILTQQAHGAQPMVELLALRQCAGRGQDGGHGMDSEALQTDLDAVSDAKASTQPLPLGRQQVIPVPPGAPPEVVASWEYHHRRLQMLEDGGGLTALEPQRMRAITVLRDRLDKRREKGLPTPTDYKKHQAATCIQAGIRGYLVRQWTSEELAREMRRQRALEASAFESSPTSDAKKRAAYRVIYAARRAFVEYNAAVKIQKVARGTMTRAKLKRQISRIAHSSAAKVQ
ncbi:unnamed protein product, partial [Symbiodinium pilosum]